MAAHRQFCQKIIRSGEVAATVRAKQTSSTARAAMPATKAQWGSERP